MPLFYAKTWEHALLAETVKAAQDADTQGYLGRTAIQKIVYFLQTAGVPMRYGFDIYHYGPFCDRVSRDVEYLLADEVLTDASNDPGKYSNYKAGGAAEELLAKHPSLQRHRETIRSVVRTLLPLPPTRLELLATMDFVYRWLKAEGGDGPWKQKVLDKFRAVKKDKFTDAEVSAAYDAMVEGNLFKA